MLLILDLGVYLKTKTNLDKDIDLRVSQLVIKLNELVGFVFVFDFCFDCFDLNLSLQKAAFLSVVVSDSL